MTGVDILTDIPGFNDISAIEISDGMSNCGIENGNNYINNSNSSTFNLSPEIKSPLAQSTFIEIEPENSIINSTQLSVEMSNEQIERYLILANNFILILYKYFKSQLIFAKYFLIIFLVLKNCVVVELWI